MIKKIASGQEEEEKPESWVSDQVGSNPVWGISFFVLILSNLNDDNNNSKNTNNNDNNNNKDNKSNNKNRKIQEKCNMKKKCIRQGSNPLNHN